MVTHELDNRGLLPPEPMVLILSALTTMADDDELRALMDREPFPLYSELARRGFAWEYTAEGDAHVLTIRRQPR